MKDHEYGVIVLPAVSRPRDRRGIDSRRREGAAGVNVTVRVAVSYAVVPVTVGHRP